MMFDLGDDRDGTGDSGVETPQVSVAPLAGAKMLLLKRSFKYRWYPTPEQDQTLQTYRRLLKILWNTALDQRVQVARRWRQGDRQKVYLNVPGTRDGQQEQLVDLKQAHPEFATIPAATTQNVLRVMERVWPAWWGGADPKHPPKPVLFSELATTPTKKRVPRKRKNGKEDVPGPDEDWRWDRVNTRGLDAYLWYTHMKRSNPYRKLKFPKAAKGMPRFKRYRDNVPIGFVGAIHVRGNIVTLPGLGALNCVMHRPIQGRVCTAAVTRDVDQWYVSLSCEFSVPAPTVIPTGTVGIDRGVAVTMADSDGRMVHLPDSVVQATDRASHLQATLLAHKRGPRKGAPPSKQWEKAQRRIDVARRLARRRREHWLHEQANYYVARYGVIKLEKLEIQNMTKSAKGTEEEPGTNVAAKAGLNREILQQGWGRFCEIVKYKAEAAGVVVIMVPAQHSSQECSVCGYVDAMNRRSQSEFVCLRCGHSANADVNAAQVIASRNGEEVTGPNKKPPRRRQRLVKGRRKEKVPAHE